jgi:predicted esterase
MTVAESVPVRGQTRSSLLPHLLGFALLACSALFFPQQARALPSEFSGSVSDFYKLPSTPASAAHGAVVRWKRMTNLSAGLVLNSDGVAGFRMMYVSTAADGYTKTYVTGTLLVPARTYNGYLNLPQIPRPIIGMGTGTQGFSDNCAASFGLENSNNVDIILIRQALDKGWAVSVSDYQGLGTRPAVELPPSDPNYRADDHTYVVGQALGRNVIDSVRASFEFDSVATTAIKNIDFPLRIGINAVLRTTSKIAFWGYSEGGNSAAWAGQLQPSYDAGLNMRAVAVGGVPADLLAAGNAINQRFGLQNVAFGVLVGAAIGFKQAYPELPFEQYLTDAGKTLVRDIKNSCIAPAVLRGLGFNLITDFTTGGFSPLTNSLWQARFNQNKLGSLPPTVPTFVYHAQSDEALEYTQGRQAARDWCARGVRVTWKSYPGEHVTGFLTGMGDALNFIEARLANQTPANTPCNQIN